MCLRDRKVLEVVSMVLRVLFWPILACLIGVGAIYYQYGFVGVYVTVVLLLLEISLSFDNAVVNARVLESLSEKWQNFFLTWGLVFPVFIVRFFGPLVIVALSTDVSVMGVLDMSIHDQGRYAKLLTEAHPKILAFGGMFLLLVFFKFFFDRTKTEHWFHRLEQQLVRMGKIESIEIALALVILAWVTMISPAEIRGAIAIAGIIGLVLNIVFTSLADYFQEEPESAGVAKGSTRAVIATLLYLEVLDASFSLDGTVGAFAISQDTWVIMTGLGLGALFIRSMTVLLVRQRILQEFVFLEHGAHYAIGALGIMMLLSINLHFSELITGTLGLICIAASLWDSWRERGKISGESL